MIWMYWQDRQMKERFIQRSKSYKENLDELEKRVKEMVAEEEIDLEDEFDLSSFIAMLKSNITMMLREGLSDHGVVPYKTIEDAFKGMGWPSDIDVEEISERTYAIGEYIVQFIPSGSDRPMKLVKKEVTVKWVLK